MYLNRAVKRAINRLVHYAGYALVPRCNQSYEELIGVPRYQEQIVFLDGAKFKIADALSFRHSYAEIFSKEIYRFSCANKNPKIVDCGSNYGTSVIYFKSLYPDASITAVECDPAIFDILVWNIRERGLTGVNAINKAVSNSTQPVRFFPEGADAGRLTTPLRSLKDFVEIPTVSLDSLLDEPVDFLKMDIEGEETKVICECHRLDRVHRLFVEYHSFVDQPQNLALLLSKLASSGFRYYIQTQFCPPIPLLQRLFILPS